MIYIIEGNRKGNDMLIKVCSKCKKIKPYLEYWKRGNTKSSITSYCIEELKNLSIDHVIPIKLYKYENVHDENFKKCWNLRNLRLISKKQNSFKKDYLDINLIKKFKIKDLLPVGG